MEAFYVVSHTFGDTIKGKTLQITATFDGQSVFM
jgi:hypothetical protein